MQKGDSNYGLTMIEDSFTKDGRRWALFQCECGNKKYIRVANVSSGSTRYCGCHYGKNNHKTRNKKHGDTNTRLYSIWSSLKKRCKDKQNPNYGGRGITYCKEWEQYEAFKKWSLENGYNEKLTIDRIDVNKGYCPENCRWISPKEQANNKGNNIRITLNGETKTLAQWCEHFNVPYSRMRVRLSRGWKKEDLFKEYERT